MQTLKISISDIEFKKFGFKSNNLSFSELLEIVDKEFAKNTLRESVELAEKYNLSKMSMEEITNEVNSVRFS